MNPLAAQSIPEQSSKQSAIIRVERAIGDVRLGAWVVLVGDSSAALYGNPETLGNERVSAWLRQNRHHAALVIPSSRALRIGLKASGKKPVKAALNDIDNAEKIAALIYPVQKSGDNHRLATTEANALDEAAIRLSKQAFLLPCMLTQPLAVKTADAEKWAFDNGLIAVHVSDILSYRDEIACSVDIVSEARVPLHGAKDARVVAFRPRIGNAEHLAVVVGDISKVNSPLVRVHSSCITGDILGSLRCDCGDQLHAAIHAMGNEGAGVLLYLNQEGRGIGIANKLRAYTLQDSGLDTVDANEEVGFDADERTFMVAVRMLARLGVKSVRLMTNNPKKADDLSRLGITVSERVPLVIPPNEHNSAYLDTKAKRCGHIL